MQMLFAPGFDRSQVVAAKVWEHLDFYAPLISTRLQPGESGYPADKTRFNGLSLRAEAVETAFFDGL